MSDSKVDTKANITLELGDIILLRADTNEILNGNSFLITYLDKQVIELTNIITLEPYSLFLDERGILTDESIQEILLVSRSEEKGFARQNGLLPNTWIDIHFGGEVPVIITGEITNLEEDMIEIKRYPITNLETIYINFDYKGIPKNIPLDEIVIRPKPKSLESIASLVNIEEVEDLEEAKERDDSNEVSVEYSQSGEMIITTPSDSSSQKSVKDQLEEIYQEANDIIYAEELGEFVDKVELPEHQQRYSIETQVNDLLDELILRIPEEKRTLQVLNNIHFLINRFRELRSQFSKFDPQGNVSTNTFLGEQFKPLAEKINKLDQKLKWIVPIVSLRKKVYTDRENDTYSDVSQIENGEDLYEEQNLMESYTKNQLRNAVSTKYVYFHQLLHPYETPMEGPQVEDVYITSNQKVNQSLECIVNNLGNFYSTILRAGKKDHYEREQYVVQRYNLGQEYLEPSVSQLGKRVFIRHPMTENDELTMKSLLTLPKPIIHFSKIDLPMSSILEKSQYSSTFFHMFQYFHKKMKMDVHEIEQLHTNKGEEIWKVPGEEGILNDHAYHFTMDEGLEYDEDDFHKFLQSVFPNNDIFVKLLKHLYKENELYSFLSVFRSSKALEPFLLYTKFLNYSDYNSIRYFVKTYVNEYRKSLEQHKNEMNTLVLQKYANSYPEESSMLRMFSKKEDLKDIFLDLYEFQGPDLKPILDAMSSSEILGKVIVDDYGTLYFDLIKFMLHSLVVPEEFMKALIVDEDEFPQLNKESGKNCARHVLSKKYTSLTELFKDNHKEIYFDKEYDFTPYELLSKYENKRQELNKDDFLEFLITVLIQKHEVPIELANDIAVDLLFGKKLVKTGDYALVEIKPEPKKEYDKENRNEKEEKELLMEADIRKKTAYYKRANNQWNVDTNIDEYAFIDNSSLFCNLNKNCVYNKKNNICESMDQAARNIENISKKELKKEFDVRYALSKENLERDLGNKVKTSMQKLSHYLKLNHVLRYKYNNVHYELGRLSKEVETLQCPYYELKEAILGQFDFVKKQSDIIKFVNAYCREPLIELLGEKEHMYYCKETNTPLLPTFFYDLAKAFVSENNYLDKLNEIIRKQGTESDDGDAIIDKYSGYVLRKKDSVQEDQYDDQGFKKQTSSLLEADIGDLYKTMKSGQQELKDVIFENEYTQRLFNIFRALSRNLGIPISSIQEEVLRISSEIVERSVESQSIYEEKAKKADKKLIPYEDYQNKRFIFIVSTTLLFSIQTAIPSFKVHKTIPGCVKSFEGFPNKNGSMENTAGVDYIACLLYKMKQKTLKPWDSIYRLPLEVIKSQFIQTCQQTILSNNTLMEKYVKKEEYMLLHPDLMIPEELSVSHWKQFLPPVVKFSVSNYLRGLSSEFKEELRVLQIKGSDKQRQHKNVYLAKCLQYGFSIIEKINNVIKKKALLLKTSSQLYFTENACCNERHSQSFLKYFEEENEEIVQHKKQVYLWQKIIQSFQYRAMPAILFDAKRTGLTYGTELPSNSFEYNIYLAFIHYCNLGNLQPIPLEYQPVFSEKLDEFPKKAPLTEQIEFLKRHGKTLNSSQLKQLMTLVNRKNKVTTHFRKEEYNRVAGLKDFLSYCENKYGTEEDIVFSHSFCNKLKDVVDKYNPKIMVKEDNEEVYDLNNWLTRTNELLLNEIIEFIQQHGNLSNSKMQSFESYLSTIHLWSMEEGKDPSQSLDSVFVISKFLQNIIFSNSRVFPEIIENNHSANSASHLYWNFSDEHDSDISHFIKNYYNPLEKFFEDKTIDSLLGEVKQQLLDVNLFLQVLPIHRQHASLYEDKQEIFYSLFDKRTIYMLYVYIYYSILHEYIKATDNNDLIQMDRNEKKLLRRNAIEETNDEFILGESQEDYGAMEEAEFGNDRIEIEIQAGNLEEIKSKIANLLTSFISVDMQDKKILDVSYEENEKRVIKSRLKEKKIITDYLANISEEELKIEELNKQLKLGRWNVGLQKGLVEYNPKRYNEERKQLFEQMNGRLDLDEAHDVPIQRSVDDLNQEEQEQVNEFYDEEANNFQNYRGDDADGGYYEEDFDEEFQE